MVWGDGTSNTSAEGSGTVTVVASGSGFAVRGSHTYLKVLTGATFSVSVVDHTASTSATATINVADAPITSTSVIALSALEGANTGTIVVAAFTDANPNGVASDFTATIDWGDATTSPGVILANANGTFSVTGSHTYTQAATGLTLKVTVTSIGGVSDSATATLAVAERAVVLNAPPLGITAVEGTSTGSVVVATFADPAGPELTSGQPTPGEYSATIDWGDGSATDTSTTITWSSATQTFSVQGSHTYTQESASGTPYQIKVSVRHGTTDVKTTTTVTALATVADAQIQNLVLDPTALPTTGQVGVAVPAGSPLASFTDPGSAAEPLAEYVATINWGDGATGLGIVTGTSTPGLYQVSASGPHTYAAPGTYTVTVSVKHNALPTLSTAGRDIILLAQPTPSLIRTTVGVFDPLGDPTNGFGVWHLRSSTSPGPADAGVFPYGMGGWTPVVGDWDGDGVFTVGVVDPATGTWYLRNSNSPGAPDYTPFTFGSPSWLPVVGDWTNSGHTGIGLFDPATATWHLRTSINAGPDAFTFAFGAPGWKPVAGDWNGDGTFTVGVFDPLGDPANAFGVWHLRNSNSPGSADAGLFAYGAGYWTPVVGDWNGDGLTTVGAYRSDGDPANSFGVWFLRNSNSAGSPDAGQFAYGATTWKPVAGVWNTVPQSTPTSATATSATGLQSWSNLYSQTASALTASASYTSQTPTANGAFLPGTKPGGSGPGQPGALADPLIQAIHPAGQESDDPATSLLSAETEADSSSGPLLREEA